MADTYTNSVTTDTPVVTTAETAAVVSDPVSTGSGAEEITINGAVSITTGTGTTAVTLRCRRGSGVAGAVVGETEPVTIGAAASANIPYSFSDTPGEVAGQLYTLTVQQTAASANGTINNASITLAVGV